jgi:hypothetical protein
MPQDSQRFRLSRQGLMLTMISAAFAGNAWSQTAAHIDFAVGSVTATGQDGRSRALAKGAEVLTGDRVQTTAGRAQLRFTDGAYVSLQPNTTFEVREYQYSGRTDGSEKGVFGLLRGALRTVTGIIGRVNRGAYQIQTPTATIGIRGTGGVIEVLADGTTRVTGTSGTWFINKRGRKALDVPAGTIGEASPDPNEDPKETAEQPILVPPQPIEVAGVDALPPAAGPATYVAGDQVTSAGAPAIVTPTLVTSALSCAAGCEIAFASLPFATRGAIGYSPATGPAPTLSSSGELTTFVDATTGQTLALTGSTADFGTADGVLAWGRWIGSATIDGAPWTGFQTLPYVIGLPSPIADLTASTSTFTYNLIGATAPTDGTNIGVVTGGTLVGAFGPSPTVGIDLSFTLAGGSYNINSGGTTIGIGTGGPYAAFATSSVSASGSGCTCGCFASVNGYFAGAGATHAGFSYQVSGATQQPVVGAAAFKR